MGEVGSSSFEFYEGLRVLLPGSLIVGLYAAVTATFGVGGSLDLGGALFAVLVALAIGVVLLFLDLPSKAAVFFFQAPEAHLRSWTDVKPTRGSHMNVYFELLDTEVPLGIRNRILYYGAIYRVGFEMLYITASSVVVLLIAVLFPSMGTVRTDNSSTALRFLFLAAGLVHLGIIAVAVWSRFREHVGKKRPGWAGVKKDLSAEIPTYPDRLLLAAGLLAILACMLRKWDPVAILGITAPLFVWGFRYFRGVALAEGRRGNLHGVTASVLFGFSAVSLCAVGSRWAESHSSLDATVACGWLGVTVVAAALIAARGHERRLTGSYALQRLWFDHNKSELIEAGYFTPVHRAEAGESMNPLNLEGGDTAQKASWRLPTTLAGVGLLIVALRRWSR